MLQEKTLLNVMQLVHKIFTIHDLCRILMSVTVDQEKTNALLNLINLQIDIHKTYLCAKDSYDVKY